MKCTILIHCARCCRMEEERTGLDLTRGQVQEDLAEVVRNLGLVETALEETQVKVNVYNMYLYDCMYCVSASSRLLRILSA